jgi:methionyl-tRNA formyltransferase
MELMRQLLETAALNPSAIPLVPQDLNQREYFGKMTPEDGWLAWSRPAREIFNFVRAADYSPFHSPWKHPRSVLEEQEIGFVKVALTGQRSDMPPGTISRFEEGKVRVACGDEWVAVSRIVLDGRYVNGIDMLKLGNLLEWKR